MSAPTGCPVLPQAAALAEICRRNFQRPRPDGRIPRQFHDKPHACLAGSLTIEPPAEPALRHGLFARPGRYPALIRFSNAFFADDRTPDGMGAAIKLTGVEGELCEGASPGEQDFLFNDVPTGAAADAAAAAALFSALDGVAQITPVALLAPRYAVPSLLPPRLRWRYLALLLRTAWQHLQGRDLARASFYSVTPYALGEGATKYELRPDATTRRRMPGRDIAERLQAVLDQGPLGFDFMLQPRLRPDDPLDDASRPWRSPRFRAGRLEIPPQNVAASAARGEGLAFNPWNCLAAHRPLGSLNALRGTLYRASAAARGCPGAAGPPSQDPRPRD